MEEGTQNNLSGETSDNKLYSTSPNEPSSLLADAINSGSSPNRKARSVEAGSSNTYADKPNFSPPSSSSWRTSLQQAARRPSSSRDILTSERLNLLGQSNPERQNTLGLDNIPTDRAYSFSEGSIAINPNGRRESIVENTGVNQSQSVPPHRGSISSSILSWGSAIISSAWNANSNPSSMAGSDVGDSQPEGPLSGSTTAISPVSVTSTGHSGVYGAILTRTPSNNDRRMPSDGASGRPSVSSQMGPPLPPLSRTESGSRTPRGRAGTARTFSGLNYTTGTSSSGSERSALVAADGSLGIIGVCALDSKARTKPSRNILNRINAKNEFEVILFGDKVILDEAPENWPLCDYFISFFSEGFPLDKAIEYVRLRKPFSVNDLPMQMVLWDRRLCLQILDRYQVPTPSRVEVSRDGGPTIASPELAQHISKRTGIKLHGPDTGVGGGLEPPKEVIMIDDDTIRVDGVELKKPFVEKPVSGEDHNVYIYFSSSIGGGGRRLFRKVNNKSSEADSTLNIPRSITDPTSSFIYESFLSTQNHEDVKAYTVGPDFCHAETRKSPVVDGIVKRNTHGKEIRYVTSLTEEERTVASKISQAFGQWVCGFDLLRTESKSFVIDVNGWSFVKDNNEYYDRCASLLRDLFITEKLRRDGKLSTKDGEDMVETEPLSRQGAFSSLKSLLKSPSMSRLHNTHHQSIPRMNNAISSDNGLLSQSPVSSPPSTESLTSLRISSGIRPEIGTVSAPPGSIKDGTIITETSGDGAVTIPPPATKAQWRLKGMVSVIRHADRTPKQKLKFTFHTKPFEDLLKGHREEVLLIGEAALSSVLEAVTTAQAEGQEDPEKLKILRICLVKKGSWPGTKVQIKPMFRKNGTKKGKADNADPSSPTALQKGNKKANVDMQDKSASDDRMHLQVRPHQAEHRNISATDGVTLSRVAAEEENLEIEKLQLIIKWGGEPTHSARYQSQELGELMRNDLLLMNRDAVDNLKVFSSSERRSTTSAQIWTASFLNEQDVPSDFIELRKDLLDDSNAAKDEMDKVKKKLKGLLREGHKAPPQFTWPENMPEPFIVARNVVELMKFHRRVMNDNFARLYAGVASSMTPGGKDVAPITIAQAIQRIQPRWCSGEDADLFRERWEKLFTEFQDPDKVDPGRISELHDTIKFDALHNRPFLEWIFTPSQALMDEFYPPDPAKVSTPDALDEGMLKPSQRSDPKQQSITAEKLPERTYLAQRMGFKKRLALDSNELRRFASNPATESYFGLYTGDIHSRSKADARLEKLRELFLYSKILFDFIGPQEYGITDEEKLEIGLLTSLPLLKAIVNDLTDMQASPGAKTRVYFTKESHIYTLLNCIVEGGIPTKIERNKIPELDYLSTISFELYESQNPTEEDEADSFNYSIRIAISPGCHTFEPLDVQLDSKHCIGFAQRRSLTAHIEWRTVIETLRAKFHTVNLPKSFIAVNLSEKVPQEFECSKGELQREITSEYQAAEKQTEDGKGGSEDQVDVEATLGDGPLIMVDGRVMSGSESAVRRAEGE